MINKKAIAQSALLLAAVLMIGFGIWRGGRYGVGKGYPVVYGVCLDWDKKNGSFLARFRGWFQAGAALLTNIHLPNFARVFCIRARAKQYVCRGLNCHPCPGAAGACPIGSFQAVVACQNSDFPIILPAS